MLRRSIKLDFTRRPEIYCQLSLIRSLVKMKSSVGERDLVFMCIKSIFMAIWVLEDAGFLRVFRVLLGTILSNAEIPSPYLLSVLKQYLL